MAHKTGRDAQADMCSHVRVPDQPPPLGFPPSRANISSPGVYKHKYLKNNGQRAVYLYSYFPDAGVRALLFDAYMVDKGELKENDKLI